MPELAPREQGHGDLPGVDGARQASDWLLERARSHRLSPTQRRVVQCMLDSLPELAFRSAGEIAERAGVSQPTVTRLAAALGFGGYQELRTAAREAVLARPAAGRPTEPHDTRVAAVEEERANLAALRPVVADGSMGAAVRLLAGTDPLGVVGLRASAALAHYFGYFARRVLPGVSVLTDAGEVDDAVLDLAHGGASALLVFAMPRYPAGTVRAVRRAHGLGMATVVVADTPLLPFAGDVDELLVAPVGQGLVFDSHAAAVVLAAALLDAVASTDPRRTQERLEAHEGLVDGWAHRGR